MDAFGIDAGVLGATRVYFQAARRTGRTTALIESLQDGDRVIVVNEQERRRLSELAALLHRKVTFVVLPTDYPEAVFKLGQSEGRTIFDHTWVEEFYLAEMRRLRERLDRVQREASGYGMAHIETRLRAQEIARWRE